MRIILNRVLREIKKGLTGQDCAASVKELGDKPALKRQNTASVNLMYDCPCIVMRREENQLDVTE